MLKKVLFLYLAGSLLWIVGCLQPLDQGGGSSILSFTPPTGSEDVQFKFKWAAADVVNTASSDYYKVQEKQKECEIEDITDKLETVDVTIKNSCIENPSFYTVTLSLKIDGDTYSGSEVINAKTPKKGNTISITIPLKSSKGGTKSISSNESSHLQSSSETTNVDIGSLIIPEGYTYVGPFDAAGSMYILQNEHPKTNRGTSCEFRLNRKELTCNDTYQENNLENYCVGAVIENNIRLRIVKKCEYPLY